MRILGVEIRGITRTEHERIPCWFPLFGLAGGLIIGFALGWSLLALAVGTGFLIVSILALLWYLRR